MTKRFAVARTNDARMEAHGAPPLVETGFNGLLEAKPARMKSGLRRLPPGQLQITGDLVIARLTEQLPSINTARLPYQQTQARLRHVWIDYSDLIQYFEHNRIPTGIQRVQIEIYQAARQAGRDNVAACCFDAVRGCWIPLPAGLFRQLVQTAAAPSLDAAGGDGADTWRMLIAELKQATKTGEPAAFAPNDVLVNLGSSWWIPDYMQHVRFLQREYGVLYAPFVHDCIPIKVPETCSADLVREFRGWFADATRTADVVLVNSDCTGRDVVEAVGNLAATTMPDLHVVRLDARFDGPAGLPNSLPAPLRAQVLARYGLRRPFALFVSTIEARKNHIFIFQAWKRLIDEHGADAVPDLICVGKRGWLVDYTLNWLKVNPDLASKIRLIGSVSDLELAVLYRSALFTVYCSLYEGWGLPVTESLCHGRVPLVPTHSSLREAGGDLAVYYTPGSSDDFCTQALTLMDPTQRARLEADVTARFRPRAWTDVLDQILSVVRDAVPRVDASVRGFTVERGLIYGLGRDRDAAEHSLALPSGKWAKYGRGWWPAESWGCWSRLESAQLMFSVDSPELPASSIYLIIYGGPRDQTLAVTAGPHRADGIVVRAGQRRLLRLPLSGTAGQDGGILVTITAPIYKLAPFTGGADPREIGFGLEALGVVAQKDAAGRADLAEYMLMSG